MKSDKGAWQVTTQDAAKETVHPETALTLMDSMESTGGIGMVLSGARLWGSRSGGLAAAGRRAAAKSAKQLRKTVWRKREQAAAAMKNPKTRKQMIKFMKDEVVAEARAHALFKSRMFIDYKPLITTHFHFVVEAVDMIANQLGITEMIENLDPTGELWSDDEDSSDK
jgi:hypothetical protein